MCSLKHFILSTWAIYALNRVFIHYNCFLLAFRYLILDATLVQHVFSRPQGEILSLSCWKVNFTDGGSLLEKISLYITHQKGKGLLNFLGILLLKQCISSYECIMCSAYDLISISHLQLLTSLLVTTLGLYLSCKSSSMPQGNHHHFLRKYLVGHY